MLNGVKLLELITNTKNEVGIMKNNFENAKNEIDNRQNALNDKIRNEKEKTNFESYILSISGVEFQTKLSVLLNEKSLFTELLEKNIFRENKIFIDRPPFLFSHILDYLRFKLIDLSKFKDEELQSLQEEAEYYQIESLINLIKEKRDFLINFIHFDISKVFKFEGLEIGNFDIECLETKDLTTGICVGSPGFIVLELNRPVEIYSLEIGGYTGNRIKFASENGRGATIMTSTDRVNWEVVGAIPYNFGNQIVKFVVKKSRGSYIKFSSQSSIGIGYLKIN